MTYQLPDSNNTNTSKFHNSNMFTFIATLSGVVVGVMASLAMVGPMLHSEVASATKGTRTLNARPADFVSSCSVPTGQSGSAANGSNGQGSVLGAFTATAPATGTGAGGGMGGGGSNTFVHNLVTGMTANTTATISGNGANSNNKVVTVNKNTTTIHNDNNVTLTNNNPQTATSGDAKSSENTDSNANATSGIAKNDSDTSMNVNITN